MMGSMIHCFRSCCDDDDDDNDNSNEHSPQQEYNPPPATLMTRRSDIAEDDNDNDLRDNCCQTPTSREQRTLFSFWKRLSERAYQEVHQQDEARVPDVGGVLMMPPPGMPRRSSSLGKNKNPKEAQTFEKTRDIPSIHAEEIVMPGSALQEQMASEMASMLEEQGDECVICMEGFTPDNPRMPTVCGCGENKTYFHLPCLYQWMEQSQNCPSCRQRLEWEEF